MSTADAPANNGLQLDVRGLPPEDAVNQMVEKAVAMKASDLFFCTNETTVTIAMRHLGMLRRLSEACQKGASARLFSLRNGRR